METEAARKEPQRVPTVAEQLCELLRLRKRTDLADLLVEARIRFDVDPGPYGLDPCRRADIYAPFEAYEKLCGLRNTDREAVLECLGEISPGSSQLLPVGRIGFRLDTSSLVSPAHRLFVEPTGWAKVDEGVSKVQGLARTAGGVLDCTSLGNACLHVLISLAETVHDPKLHPTADGVEPSETDAKRKLEAYVNYVLPGGTNKEAREFVKSAIALATALKHDRRATPVDAAVCAEATLATVNLIAILAGRRELGKGPHG